jgi:hypothetical protein
MSTTPDTTTPETYEVGQQVEFAANKVWYPGTVTKVGRSTVTVTYVKGSGEVYTQTVNPSNEFHAGGRLGTVPSRVRPLTTNTNTQETTNTMTTTTDPISGIFAPPTWQTLKGVVAGDLIANSGDRKSEPLPTAFHIFAGRDDQWTISTTDGTHIRSGGVATKYWVRKNMTPGAESAEESKVTPIRSRKAVQPEVESIPLVHPPVTETGEQASVVAIERSAPQRLEEGGKELVRLTANLKGAVDKGQESAVTKWMLALRDAGASYAQIAEVLGVVPMTARSRVLKAQSAR